VFLLTSSSTEGTVCANVPARKTNKSAPTTIAARCPDATPVEIVLFILEVLRSGTRRIPGKGIKIVWSSARLIGFDRVANREKAESNRREDRANRLSFRLPDGVPADSGRMVRLGS